LAGTRAGRAVRVRRVRRGAPLDLVHLFGTLLPHQKETKDKN